MRRYIADIKVFITQEYTACITLKPIDTHAISARVLSSKVNNSNISCQ
jgi:hypothetical protein